MTILAIESSCDDTSAAVLVDGIVLSNTTSSQKIHEQYGGVVPEVASRQHHIDIVPVVNHAMSLAECQFKTIDAIAFTRGPGLLGSLLVGASFAKALALALDKPLIEVHHMKAHIMAHFIDEPKPNFPFLCLTVSGGHTQIVKVNSGTKMVVLGQTIDDAAGEAFDKTGKMLGLGYPAGPEIDKRAKLGKAVFTFSESKLPGLDFSFSGFKTSVLYFLQKEKKKDSDFIDKNLNDLCASIQNAIIHMLVSKLKQAATQTGITEIAIAGGVAANSGLRTTLLTMAKELSWKLYVPDIQYCTDNAGMIAMAAWFKFQEGDFSDLATSPDPRWAMDEA
ncbi:MAG: tRNA (adenosine(37)-N6)-threonylcarbamoyltransferase complex transferase subunit TsaD [Saprospiraceae bacterium]|nr:tRNA (adenosine(37)-N6)-threonylcarbamoyltransferase complex transferase subunit TsaD [Saprospiraceae bacterium]